MNNVGGKGYALWDEQDGFYYDVLYPPAGTPIPLKIRSVVGLIPLFAVDEISADLIDTFPDFRRRAQWFLKNRPEFLDYVETKPTEHGPVPAFLALVNRNRLRRILHYMLSEEEFLSPYGIRSLSKHHQREPYRFNVDGQEHRVDYEPGESSSYLFGGNSNWRGPIWLPVNFLLMESLQKFHHYFGDDYRVECPTGSGRLLTLWEVAAELSRRLSRLFLQGPDGKRPLHGNRERFQTDANWNEYIPFYEYFHADTGAGLGASHQTGWTALVAKTLQQSGE
jgi:hypothetical protein